MPQFVSVFIAQHPPDISAEVAMAEALAGDAALQEAGFKLVGGAYANEGDAVKTALRAVMAEDEEG